MSAAPYNFQKPGRLNSALDQQFHGWLQTACALATRRFQRDLPFPAEVLLGPSDNLRARAALLTLPEDTIAYRVPLQEHLPTVMAWPRLLVLGLISTLLGDKLEGPPADRELTAVDDSLFEFFLRDMLLPAFLESWTGQNAIHPQVGEKISNPRYAKVYGADESLLVASFKVKGQFGDYDWRWLVPKNGLLANQQDEAAAEQQAQNRERLLQQVRELPVELVVTLGSAELPLTQLARLRVGDIILLDQPVNQPLVAKVADNDKLRGWPGKVGTRQAFRIEQWR
ncbi:MAG: FliM/FliN family flagellar motor switch protein [Gemmataceae bacterium]